MSADDIAVLRIELIDIEPLIWRRVAVKTTTNLQTLHRIIQAAMGWQDYHLWEFTADEELYGIPEPDDAMWDRKVRRASATKLANLVERGVSAFDYTYDMATTGSTASSSSGSSRPSPVGLIPSSAAANGAAHPRIAAAFPAITSSSTSSPAPTRARAAARKRKCSPGTAAPTIPTTSTRRKSAVPSSALPTPAAADQNPSTPDRRVHQLTLTRSTTAWGFREPSRDPE